MAVDAAMVRDLRDKSGAGVMDCKTALQESDGDVGKALDILRKRGIEAAESKKGRKITEGRVGSYIHFGGRIGVLLELRCETDFVAKTSDFQNLLKDVCMHVAASDPKWVSRDDVPGEILEKEKEVYQAQFTDKPPQVIEKILTGKLESFFKENCLLEQAYVKDQDVTVGDYIKSHVGKLGENIELRRFARFTVGE